MATSRAEIRKADDVNDIAAAAAAANVGRDFSEVAAEAVAAAGTEAVAAALPGNTSLKYGFCLAN